MSYVTPGDVKKLIRKHSVEPFNPRDSAMIAAVGMGYFSAVELSLVCVRHLVGENGKILVHDFLPAEFSALGRPRKFYVGKNTYFRQALENYINWRKDRGYGLLDRQLYCGLDPESKFFLKDNGQPYEVNYKRRHEGDTAVQALQIQRHFKKFFLGEEVSFKKLQESFLHSVWDKISAEKGSVIAVKVLMAYTNLAPDTIRRKCIRDGKAIADTLEGIFK